MLFHYAKLHVSEGGIPNTKYYYIDQHVELKIKIQNSSE